MHFTLIVLKTVLDYLADGLLMETQNASSVSSKCTKTPNIVILVHTVKVGYRFINLYICTSIPTQKSDSLSKLAHDFLREIIS